MTTFVIIYIVGYLLALAGFTYVMIDEEGKIIPRKYVLSMIVSLLSWILILTCVFSIIVDAIVGITTNNNKDNIDFKEL